MISVFENCFLLRAMKTSLIPSFFTVIKNMENIEDT